MFHSHWLMKKLIWPIAKQNKGRWEIQTEKYREEEGQSLADGSQQLHQRDVLDQQVRHETHGIAQINRNGLISKQELVSNKTEQQAKQFVINIKLCVITQDWHLGSNSTASLYTLPAS